MYAMRSGTEIEIQDLRVLWYWVLGLLQLAVKVAPWALGGFPTVWT